MSDLIASLLTEAIEKAVRNARAQSAAAGAPAAPRAGSLPPRHAPAAPPPQQRAVAPAPPAPAAPQTPEPNPGPDRLAAFRTPAAFLSAVILSEALALPLALRRPDQR